MNEYSDELYNDSIYIPPEPPEQITAENTSGNNEETAENGNRQSAVKESRCNYSFLLFRIIVVAVMLLSLLITKFCFADVYKTIKEKYNSEFSVNISPEYFLSEEEK